MQLQLEHLSSLVLIVGLSGAGKSTASKVLADIGFYSTDNLPVHLLPQFIEHTRGTPQRYSKTCLLLDIESQSKRDDLLGYLGEVASLPSNVRLLFLDSSNDTLLKRYSESRRPHPSFDPLRDKTLADTIQRERGRLQPIKDISHFIIDTSEFTVHDLKRELHDITDSFAKELNKLMRVNFLSFGFKFGAPLDCDLVMDVRFLPNPHFVEALREKTGLDKDVSNFVLSTETAKNFLTRYQALLHFLLPHYAYEGKVYLNIGIGCTGGQHRSVAISEYLAHEFHSEQYIVSAKHRDVERSRT